jgi:hypothetical protein
MMMIRRRRAYSCLVGTVVAAAVSTTTTAAASRAAFTLNSRNNAAALLPCSPQQQGLAIDARLLSLPPPDPLRSTAVKMAFRAAGDDDHDDDDDLEDVKVRLGALEEAVSKLTDSGGEGGTYNAHAPQQQSTIPVPAEPAGFTAEILRAKLELSNEIHKVGKELTDETNAKLEGTNAKLTNVTGEIAGLRLEVQGLRGEINTQGAVLQGQITALQSDMTEVKDDSKGIRKDISSFKADATNQFYTVLIVLAFVAASVGKLSMGDFTALIGK